MGSAHVRTVTSGKVKGMEIAAVCDRNPARKELFPDIAFFDEADALIASDTVDAVLVATPHYDHTTLGIATLKAGKHLLVEKPISVHKADCEKLIAAHTDDTVVFSAMFNQRTDPRYRKQVQIVLELVAGDVEELAGRLVRECEWQEEPA